MNKSKLKQLIREEIEIVFEADPDLLASVEEHCGFCPEDDPDYPADVDPSLKEFGDFPIPLLPHFDEIGLVDFLKKLPGQAAKAILTKIRKEDVWNRPGTVAPYKSIEGEQVWAAKPKKSRGPGMHDVRLFKDRREAEEYARSGDPYKREETMKEFSFKKIFDVGGGIHILEIFKFFNKATVPEINKVQKLINDAGALADKGNEEEAKRMFQEARVIIDRVLSRNK